MKVDKTHNYWDRQILHYTKLGLTAKAIKKKLIIKMSEGMIRYRQSQFNVSSLDYRNGESPLVREEIRRIDKMLNSIRDLRKRL